MPDLNHANHTGITFTQSGDELQAEVSVAPYSCILGSTVPQSIPGSTFADVTFDTEDDDTDGMGDVANNRIVIQTPGRYLLGATVTWGSNDNGERRIIFDIDGSANAFFASVAVGTTNKSVVSKPFVLTAGQVVSLRVFQDSGGTLDLTAVRLWVLRVAT